MLQSSGKNDEYICSGAKSILISWCQHFLTILTFLPLGILQNYPLGTRFLRWQYPFSMDISQIKLDLFGIDMKPPACNDDNTGEIQKQQGQLNVKNHYPWRAEKNIEEPTRLSGSILPTISGDRFFWNFSSWKPNNNNWHAIIWYIWSKTLMITQLAWELQHSSVTSPMPPWGTAKKTIT